MNVPIPDAVVTPAHGELPPFFAGTERIFALGTLGDVEDGPGHAERVAGRTPMDVAARMHDTHVTVRTDNAALDIVGRLSYQRVVDRRQDEVVIVGEQGG